MQGLRPEGLVHEPPGRDLGRLDVRLIERVDPEPVPGDGRRHLPEEELAPEIPAVGEREDDDRMTGLVQPREGRHARVVRPEAHVHEEPVGPIHLGPPQRLTHHRNDPGSVLPGALRQELLHPVREAL
jgi:hypothetical protein